MEVTEWYAPAHGAVQKGSRYEAAAISSGGGEGILLEWFSNADKIGVFYCKIINGS